MPYVEDEKRRIVNCHINDLVEAINDFVKPEDYNGELNYCITQLLVLAIKLKYKDKFRYNALNDMVGILECVKLELYRRLGGPYEDKAIEKNGDIDAYRTI